MFQKILKKPFLMCIGWGLILNLIIELLGRKKPLTIFEHIWTEPLAFIFNWAFITMTLCICLFFRRKYFILTIVTAAWLTLGIANFCVLTYRTNPLCAIDIFIMQFSWEFIGKYLNLPTILLLCIGVPLLVTVLVLIFRKAPRSEVKLKFAIPQIVAMAVIASVLIMNPLGMGIKSEKLSNLKESYNKYGFVYCFFRGSVERGIDEPDTMTDLQKAMKKIDEIEDKDPSVKPNVIMLQLESFFDINLLNDIKLSENPVPFYTYLRDNYSWGKLSVPTIGAGTANTEFEVLSQMDIDFFGTGEYPYKTILKDETTESAAFDFKELGYTAFAVHSNNATFYDRNQVFSTLGFDYFISKEYMNNYEVNPKGWMKDKKLTGEIFKCLNSTLGSDYVYTITVQGHGAYPNDKREDNEIKVISSDKQDEGINNQIEYYANQLKETDDFLRELITKLQDFDEPTVVVLYGDHMPSLDIDSDELFFGDLFETEYVIWSNFDIERQREDLQAYQLTSHVMDKLGINNGTLTKIHQTLEGKSNYLDILEQAQYDMLYGEKDVYGGVEKYTPTNLKMGIDPISISRIYQLGEYAVIKGCNFTKSSYVYVNGSRCDTLAVSSATLKVKGLELKAGDEIEVVQLSDDAVELSSTGITVYNPTG